jgi:hypothetical protein
MNIGTAKFATAIAMKVFDDFLREFQKRKSLTQIVIDNPFRVTSGSDDFLIQGDIELDIQPPSFSIQVNQNDENYTRFDVNGSIKFNIANADGDGFNKARLNFSAKLLIRLLIKPDAHGRPVIGLHYDGVESFTGPLPKAKIEEFLLNKDFLEIIDKMEMDVIVPLLIGLFTIYRIKLYHKDYNLGDMLYEIRLMKGDSNHNDALGILVDLPEDSDIPEVVPSFLSKNSEFIFHTAPYILHLLLGRGRDELWDYIFENKAISLRNLTLKTENNYIYVDCTITEKKHDVDVNIKGPVFFKLVPGYSTIVLDFNEVDIDLELSWWQKLVVAFIGASGKVDNIPDLAQRRISTMANDIIRNATSSFAFDTINLEGIPVIFYPNNLKLDEGALSYSYNILFCPVEEKLQRANYSVLRKRFVSFFMESGRTYITKDHAVYMQKGYVNLPGYQQVNGKYIRSAPDNTTSNNLLERWAPRHRS